MEETTPKKQIEFQDTFQIDFRNIDQDLPKSVRPVFSQDGFKIGKAYIEVDKGRRLMRVQVSEEKNFLFWNKSIFF